MVTRIPTLVLSAMLAALVIGPALAQQATPVPDLKGDFSSMNFLLGTWTCKTTKTTALRGAGRTETDVSTMVWDGHYMKTEGVSKPFDKVRTRDYKTEGWVGFDSDAKQWYSFGISNFGGFVLSASPGWNGDKMVWTDTYAADGVPLASVTVTKVSDTETRSTAVSKDAKGASQTTSVDCTKSA